MVEDRLHVVFGTGQVGATFWHLRHESRVTSPPIWAQNLTPPAMGTGHGLGVRPCYDRWDSRIAEAD